MQQATATTATGPSEELRKSQSHWQEQIGVLCASSEGGKGDRGCIPQCESVLEEGKEKRKKKEKRKQYISEQTVRAWAESRQSGQQTRIPLATEG